jgi:comEA protein
MTEESKKQTREMVGVVLLAGVLVMSGLLLIKQKEAPSTFTESAATNLSESSTSAVKKPAGSSSQQATNDKTTLVNINKASLEELDTLPGVGPATAQKIIDYRTQNGPFPNIEAIDNVSGIGPAKYAEIKDLITI